VRLIAGNEQWQGAVGDYVTIPPERHSLAALDDAAVLLTVVMPR
jgi:quercetin dioxygenase-like cupin family protein